MWRFLTEYFGKRTKNSVPKTKTTVPEINSKYRFIQKEIYII